MCRGRGKMADMAQSVTAHPRNLAAPQGTLSCGFCDVKIGFIERPCRAGLGENRAHRTPLFHKLLRAEPGDVCNVRSAASPPATANLITTLAPPPPSLRPSPKTPPPRTTQ